MDVEIDPVQWIVVGIGAYIAFAIIVALAFVGFRSLSAVYFPRRVRPQEMRVAVDGEMRSVTLPTAGLQVTDEHAVKCATCGTLTPAALDRCQWCGSVRQPLEIPTAQPADARSAALRASVDLRAREQLFPSYERAPLGKRYFAFLVDTFIAAGPAASGMGLMLLPTVLRDVVAARTVLTLVDMVLTLVGYVLVLVGALWFLAYYFLKDGWRNGTSAGKRLFGLMVVDVAANRPCSKRQSIIRNLGFLLPLTQLFDPVAILHDPAGCRVGDNLAGTQVIVSSDYRANTPPSSHDPRPELAATD